MDIGADKQVNYFHLKKEENPALGYRAIRICLTRPEIFKTQLRALFRASVYGNPWDYVSDDYKCIRTKRHSCNL